jgi:GNAT superfamily N-acetyltransferase
MPKVMGQQTNRNDVVTAKEIEDLRAAVGWERLENKYDKILANSYAHFTVREDCQLLAFVNVISDGIGDAFLIDLMVLPVAQRRGIGRALVETAVASLTRDGIKCIQVTFDPELESFYRDCGFHIFKGGIIDNNHRE